MSKKQLLIPHTCFECHFAFLMQSSPHNPIVSECSKTKQREVASVLLKCQYFKPKVGEAVIHPMIHCKL